MSNDKRANGTSIRIGIGAILSAVAIIAVAAFNGFGNAAADRSEIKERVTATEVRYQDIKEDIVEIKVTQKETNEKLDTLNALIIQRLPAR